MPTYWIAFRLADHGPFAVTYQSRYERVTEVIQRAGNGKWWNELTSFIIIDSTLSIDILANEISAEIDDDQDTVLIRQMDSKSARILGHVADPDVFELIPYLKPA